jgi:hypothetical protein
MQALSDLLADLAALLRKELQLAKTKYARQSRRGGIQDPPECSKKIEITM